MSSPRNSKPRTRSIAFFIGLRFILSRKDNRFLSLTSVISMSGLTLGVFALIIVLSVFNGSQGVIRDRTLITVPHAEISSSTDFIHWQEASALLSAREDITAVAPYTLTEALLSQQGYHQVTQVKGIDPTLERGVSTIEDNMLLGSLTDLRPGENIILLGRNLAGNLRLYPGDAVTLIVPESNAASNRVKMNMHRFIVGGIFDVQYTIGADLALIHIADSMDLLGITDLSEAMHLRLKVQDINQAAPVLHESLALLNQSWPEENLTGQDWSLAEASLFNSLKMEKFMTSAMLLMIVAIGSFNIISTLVKVVSEKQADIAILRTMGAGQRTILAIFFIQGLLVSVSGILIGALAGSLIAGQFTGIARFVENQISPDGLYMLSNLPTRLQFSDVVLTCLCALLISLVATFYPAWRASQILPAKVLRYE